MTRLLPELAGRDARAEVLADYRLVRDTSAAPTQVAVGTAVRHLALLGADTGPTGTHPEYPVDPMVLAHLQLIRIGSRPTPRARPLRCALRWEPSGPGASPLGASEAVIQAESGIMEVHGREQRAPRRLGLDLTAAAGGIVATQGMLAALIARRRGLLVTSVQTSILQSAQFFINHHVSIATSGGTFPYEDCRSALGPPFETADGQLVEIEVLHAESWIAFWRSLGVTHMAEVGRSWLPFVYRYLAGRCALPELLHATTRRHTVQQLRRAAELADAALCVVRGRDDPYGASEMAGAVPWRIRSWGARSMPARCARPVATDRPLSGLRVVEATSRLQGPLAGLLLQMLGAEVIKIEPPGGDFGRGSPPLARGTGAAYIAYNHGKSVVELDYKSTAGRAELQALAAGADVFLHNWRPGRAEHLGLDAAAALRRNPLQVHAHAGGWDGMNDAPSVIAGDYLVQAETGCGIGLNPPDERPVPTRLTIVDVTGGLLAAEAVLAGLYRRELLAQGCEVGTSLFSAAVALRDTAFGRERWELLHDPIPTADGFLVMRLEDDRACGRLAALLGLESSATDEDFRARVLARLRERSSAYWEAAFERIGLRAATVETDLAGLPQRPRGQGCWDASEGPYVASVPWEFDLTG